MTNHYVNPKYDQTVVAGQVKHVKPTGKLDVGNHINGGYSLTPAPYRSFVGSPVSGFHGAPNVNDNVAILYGPNNRPLAVVPILSPDNTLGVVMPALNAGESGQYHKDGRVADLLPNSGGATLYADPAHSMSFTATTTRFVMNLILSVVNLLVSGTLGVTGLLSAVNVAVSGTLGVTGLSTLTGGATVGGTLAATNETVSGTLGVTGATTLGSTLGVTGAVTVTGVLSANGSFNMSSMSVSNNPGINGTVSGASCTIIFPHGVALNINGVAHLVPLLT